MSAVFGPAGISEDLRNQNIDALKLPEILSKKGLDCFEYQCGHGVNLNDKKAEEIKNEAEKYGIMISLHSPYYISLSSTEEEKRDKSVDYILQSALAVKKLGGSRIVVHSGSCSKISREEALHFANETLIKARKALDENGLENVFLCPETMGKLNQLGTLSEVIELCKADERNIPCIDFGHLNARTLGELKTENDFLKITEEIKNKLGEERYKHFHAHFSHIEYTEKGEKKHLTFSDKEYGPFEDKFISVIKETGLSPYVICESAGTQTEDALILKKLYSEE